MFKGFFPTASWMSLYCPVSALKMLDMIRSTAHYSFHTFSVLGNISLKALKFFVLKFQFTYEVKKKPLRAEFRVVLFIC